MMRSVEVELFDELTQNITEARKRCTNVRNAQSLGLYDENMRFLAARSLRDLSRACLALSRKLDEEVL